MSIFWKRFCLDFTIGTSLKNLSLVTQLTKSSSLALRSLLHFNGTLEILSLTQLKDREKIPTMAAVLAGLAQNTGLKKFSFEADSAETNATSATARTNMIQRNTSITTLDLRKDDSAENVDADCDLCLAVAEGLVENLRLETLYLFHTENPTVFYGPVWEEVLESNRSLKEFFFHSCSISLEGFRCIARGLSHNTSLEFIDLGYHDMTDTDVIALVDGLRTNKTLKRLSLSNNDRGLSQSGMAAIEHLIGYNVLRELDLAYTLDSIGASILTIGLSDNNSLEKLDLERTCVGGEGSETFCTLCESLRGNTTLRHLDVSDNNVRVDGVCATALKLDTMSLESIDLNKNSFTSCGITALSQSLQGPCTLKELRLFCCNLDDTGLLKLGEALTVNVSLEVLDVRSNDFTHSGASQFFEMLPQMKGLKTIYGLTGRNNVPLTEMVGMALLGGLRQKYNKVAKDPGGRWYR